MGSEYRRLKWDLALGTDRDRNLELAGKLSVIVCECYGM